MHDLPVRKLLLRVAALGCLVGIAITCTTIGIVGKVTSTDVSNASRASTAVATSHAASVTPDNVEGTFHVSYNDDTHAYIRGSELTVADGTYIITDNTQGIAQIVAVFPMASVESIVATSQESN